MAKWVENCAQGSDLWLRSRCGVLTASRMADALATTKNGESDKRKKLKLDIIAERLTRRMTEVFVSKPMQWGIEQEPFAREAYENASGNIVQLCGIAFHDEIEFLAASPDGLIDDDTVWECKNPSTNTFLQYKLDNVMVAAYKPQMLLQMLTTNRSRGVFTAYDSRLPEGINLFIKEYIPTQAELDGVREAAEKFLAEVQELHDRLLQ